MKLKLFAILILLGIAINVKSQELNCQIEINYSQLQGSSNKQIFDQMKKSIYEFMNNTKWTTETYTQQEKVECSLLIIIKDGDINTGDFSGSIQVTCRRPVYKSGYYTEILNIEDENFQFRFQQFSQLEFNLNTFQSNLTQVLAYYAYVIIATDNDSFAPLGGTGYWQKAQQVVNNSQTANELGWKSSQNNKNRYWLVENTLQPVFKGIRECMYEYCRNGLDKMYESSDDSRASILKSLDLLKPVYSARPASYNMQVFFNSKRDELINIFKGATPEEKNKVKETLMLVDPAGTTKYDKI
ncbi:MAG: DUF4835 family protein [Bacteroidia bacterium]|nr:DUF4835 family protein [Bacteroidia bacterium]